MRGVPARLLALAIALPLTLASRPASAADEERHQDTLTQYAVIVADLKRSDIRGVATGEIAKLEQWISEAQAHLAAENDDDVARLVRRFKPEVQYVRAVLALSELQSRRDELKKEGEILKAEWAKFQKRTKDLDKRREELQMALQRRDGPKGLKAPVFGGGN
jgi:chromosome segregation ATPase